MTESKRVVITGLGPYINTGKGKEILWDTVINDKLIIQKIPESFERNTPLKSRFYAPFPELSFKETGLSSKHELLTDNTSRLAIICAKTALEDAGYELTANGTVPFFNENISDAAIILGVGIGGMNHAFNGFAAHNFGKHPELLQELQMQIRFNRMSIPLMMPNSISGWISIAFGISGSNYTINTACSSGNYAIGEAYRKIKDGYSEIVLAGGVENFEEKTGLIMRGFDTLGTLTKSEDGKPMPFSKKRSGFLFSEGAGCVLVLEEYERAIKRNAPIYAEICGFECNSDAKNLVMMDDSGKKISDIVEKLSYKNSIDYINTHGTGTMLNDEVEAKVIRSVFGSKSQQPYVNSTKSIIGHTIGAAAALEAAVTALSIQKNEIHANVSIDNLDDLNIAETTVQTEVNTALSLSYGFGGHNSGILLKKCK